MSTPNNNNNNNNNMIVDQDNDGGIPFNNIPGLTAEWDNPPPNDQEQTIDLLQQQIQHQLLLQQQQAAQLQQQQQALQQQQEAWQQQQQQQQALQQQQQQAMQQEQQQQQQQQASQPQQQMQGPQQTNTAQQKSEAIARNLQAKADEIYDQWLQLMDEEASQKAIDEAHAQYESCLITMRKRVVLMRARFPNSEVLNEILDQGSDIEASRDDASSQPFRLTRSSEDVQPRGLKDSEIPMFNIGNQLNGAKRGKNNKLFSSAKEWLTNFEICARHHDIETFWGEWVEYAMDDSQIQQLRGELDQIEVPAGHKWHTWQQVRETILNTFDTPVQKRQRRRDILRCKQQQGESLKSFVRRFRTVLHGSEEQPENNPLLLDIFLMNMRMSARTAAQAYLSMQGEWPDNVVKVFNHMEGLHVPEEELGGNNKRKSLEQQTNRVVRAKTSLDDDTDLPEEPVTNACWRCRDYGGILVQFGSEHKCPYYKKKPFKPNHKPASYKGNNSQHSGSSSHRHNIGHNGQRYQRSANRIVDKANKAANKAAKRGNKASKAQRQRNAYSEAVINQDAVINAERQALQQSSGRVIRNAFYSRDQEEDLTPASERQLYGDEDEDGAPSEDEVMHEAPQ